MSHYDTLGVGRSASPEEIKAAYRKLAMKHHPDRGGDQKKFQTITEAYETLSDPDKKAFYDHGGGQQGNPFGGGFHEFRSGHPFNGDPFGHPFEDVFSQFGFGFRQTRSRPKNSDLQIKVKISLKDSFVGKTMTINYPLPSGKNQTLEITIPAGIDAGQQMKMGGMGDDSIIDLPRGDLIINIDIDHDSVFSRANLDVVTSINIDVFDAMLGCKRNIKNLDGHEVELNIRPGTQNGQKYSCNGLGFPSLKFNNVKGNLIVQINVSTPAIRDQQTIDMVRSLANHIRKTKDKS